MNNLNQFYKNMNNTNEKFKLMQKEKILMHLKSRLKEINNKNKMMLIKIH